MNQLDRKMSKILIEVLERRYPGTDGEWTIRTATAQDRELGRGSEEQKGSG